MRSLRRGRARRRRPALTVARRAASEADEGSVAVHHSEVDAPANVEDCDWLEMSSIQDRIRYFNMNAAPQQQRVVRDAASQRPRANRVAARSRKDAENVVVLIVHDPEDKAVAEEFLDTIQPSLGLPVRTLSEVAKVQEELEPRPPSAVAMIVSTALGENEALVEAVGCKLPNALFPVVVESSMFDQKFWSSSLNSYMADELFFNFCDGNQADVQCFLSHIRARAKGEKPVENYDAFISHEWGVDHRVHNQAKEIKKRLETDHDLKIWLDEGQVEGCINRSMARGINDSKVFVVLATERYMKKVNDGDRADNCLKEFRYAGKQRSDRIVVAALEEEMTKPNTGWRGEFQLSLSRTKPVVVTSVSDKTVEDLADAIRERMNTPKASADLPPMMRDLERILTPCNSEGWAKGKAQCFTVGTRSWIIDELCKWYDKGKSSVFILVGDGGVGKSVIMAELCRRGGALNVDSDGDDVSRPKESAAKERRKSWQVPKRWRRSNKNRTPIYVAAYHFFRHDEGKATQPTECMKSIAWQLCLTVPGFAEELERLTLSSIRDYTLADLFKTLLVDPLHSLDPKQARRGKQERRQVVVLDALDECSESSEFLRKIIRTWKESMPTWLSLIVSTRPEGDIERGVIGNNLNYKVLELKDLENFRDIKLHIEHLLKDMSNVVDLKAVERCAALLSERSEGLFLWASFLRNTLERIQEENGGKILTYEDISKKDVVPHGLNGMFESYFSRLRNKMGGQEAYRTLLTPIVTAREPLSVEQISAILDESKNKTKQIVGDARHLLYRGGDRRVALIHKRMADWLLDADHSGDLSLDEEEGHKLLGEYCRSSREDHFAIRNAIFHSVESGDKNAAFKLLNDSTWIQSVLSIDADEAQRYTTIRNLIRDCAKCGIYFTPESNTPRFLSKAVHALSSDPKELASQMLARFGPNSDDPLLQYLEPPEGPWLEPRRASLTHPRDPLQHILKKHSCPVTSVAIENDVIVSGSEDTTVRMWDSTSGKEQRVFEGHSSAVRSVAIKGEIIVSGSDDRTVRVWSTFLGDELHILEGHVSQVLSVAIEGEGAIIVSGSRNGTIRIWNAKSGEVQRVLRGYHGAVRSLAIEGNIIVSGSDDNTVCVWDAETGEAQHSLEGHSAEVWSVAIEGNIIVSGSKDKSVRTWDVTTGENLLRLEGHFDEVRAVDIKDGNILSGSDDKTVRVWDAESGKLQHVLKGHLSVVNSVAFQGGTVVSGSDDRTLRVHKAESGEKKYNFKRHTSKITGLTKKGQFVVSRDRKKSLFWNIASGEMLGAYTRVEEFEDGRIVVQARNKLRILNAKSGKIQHNFDEHSYWVETVKLMSQLIVLSSRDGCVLGNAISGELSEEYIVFAELEDNSILAWSETAVHLWDTASGAIRHVLKGHFDEVSLVMVKDQIIVAKDEAKRYFFWNATSGKTLGVFRRFKEIDGNTIVAESMDQELSILNKASGEEHCVLEDQVGPNWDVKIEGTLVLAWFASIVHIWDVSSGELKHILEGHFGNVKSVVLKGQLLTVQDKSKSTLLWSASSGHMLGAYEHILDVEGDMIGAQSTDKTFTIWDTSTGVKKHVLEEHVNSTCHVLVDIDTIVAWSETSLNMWNVASDEPQHIFDGVFRCCKNVVIKGRIIVSQSEDFEGNHIVAESENNVLSIWNTSSGEEEFVLEGHAGSAKKVHIEGSIIVAWSEEILRIWDATSGEEQHVLKGHSDIIKDVAIQGNRIVSGSLDDTVRIWNATSGEEEHIFKVWEAPEGMAQQPFKTRDVIPGDEQLCFEVWNADGFHVAIQGESIVLRYSSGRYSWSPKPYYWNGPWPSSAMDEESCSTGKVLDAEDETSNVNEASVSGTAQNASEGVENKAYVDLDRGVGFTTDHPIQVTARWNDVCVVGDARGSVHILHINR